MTTQLGLGMGWGGWWWGLKLSVHSHLHKINITQRAEGSRVFQDSHNSAMLVHEGWALVTSSDLNCVPQTLPPNAITLGVRVSTYGF